MPYKLGVVRPNRRILRFMSIPELSLPSTLQSFEQGSNSRTTEARSVALPVVIGGPRGWQTRTMKNRLKSNERMIPLNEAVDYLPKRSGKKVHYSTLYRWATKGARGRKLETYMIGGVRFTSLEALERFIDAPVVKTPQDVDRVFDAIEDALDQAGL